MKKLTVSLSLMVLFLSIGSVALAYSIRDDATGGDCTQIGTWDDLTKICTLTRDAWGIRFDNGNGTTLDGNRFNCNGLEIYGNTSVTVKNCNAGYISIIYSENVFITGNDIGGDGLFLASVDNSKITGNTFQGGGILINGGYANQIYNNNFLYGNIVIWSGWNNIFSLDAPVGGNYYGTYDSAEEGCADSNADGFCDTPYFFSGGTDYLPLTQPIDLTAPVTKTYLNGGCSNSGTCYTDAVVSFTAQDDFPDIREIHYILDNGQETIVNGSMATVVLTTEGNHTLDYYAVDSSGNVEQWKNTAISIDKSDHTPPSIIVAATPDTLRQTGQKLLVDIAIDGAVSDDHSGVAFYNITVTDEYGVYNYSVPNFGTAIKLEAWREGQDRDGRHYTIDVVAFDLAGNSSTARTEVIVQHDSSIVRN